MNRWMVVFCICMCLPVAGFAKVYRVADFGAVNDGITMNTEAIQSAIDSCSTNGGGTVLLDGGGKYMSGTLFLKSFVTLHVANGTTLLGSPRIADYPAGTHKNMYKNEPHMDRCFIFAKDAESFAITGHGSIDGNGHRTNFENDTGRPMMLRFVNCHNIRMRDISLKHPAAWCSAWLYCDDIAVDGIDIHSWANGNGDGLDFDGCTRVRVSNSSFNTSDDSICLQASRKDKPCHDVTIDNCIFSSKWAGMRIGLLSVGDFEMVTVNNCVFRDMRDSGLKIQMNEGGSMKNMVFSNLIMKNVPRPIFMTFCQQRACTDAPEDVYPPMNELSGMMFKNMIIDNSALDKYSGIFLTGMPGSYIEDILIKDVQMTVAGGGLAEEGERILPEYTLETLDGWWPEFRLMNGPLPAFGVYARHIKGLVLENISIKTVESDARPGVKLDDAPQAEIRSIKVNGKPFSL